ncbi:Ger(x)C family spore germination protein [Paenibacillus sp. URB8-2]|uniref:Ger(x)C family spore germination protein n=1 Tax=Paenibacillus sp. URB8-2 TaxID=2741301 RepID=UPI001E4141DE|nr:Ger(x)C family spore germination protein [Paenibacillus sp. URB8-2]
MMKHFKKITVLLLILSIPSCLLTSCLGYRDLDHVVFVTSILLDRDEENNIVFYFETLNSIRSSSMEANQEKRIIYKIGIQNPGDAINELESHTSAPVTLAHNKVLLFTERFASGGVDQAFELFERWQDSSARTLLGIFVGDTDFYVKPNHQEETMTGLYLYDMLGDMQSVTSNGVKINIKEFMSQKYIGSRINSVPIVNVSKDEVTEGQYYLDGLGLIQEYKLIGKLNSEETGYYNFLVGKEVSGNINTRNPEDETKTVSMMLQNNKRYKSEVKLENEVLKLIIKIKLSTDISAVQGKLELTGETVAKMEETMEEKLERNCQKMFQEWKDKKIDIFGVQEKFERKYPSDDRKNILENTELQIDFEVKINGTSAVRDAT